MKVALFTANHPRHCALIRVLARAADRLLVSQECTTLFPGRIADFYRKSAVMERYFGYVRAAEYDVFGPIGPAPANARVLALREGDINDLPLDTFAEFLDADVIVVYGASYIKGGLCDALVGRRAVNIHMGVSPYYRGASCNFWAMHDRRPEMVGATIHLLTGGLDAGPILFHAFPKALRADPFRYGMLSVEAAHRAVAARLPDLARIDAVAQDRSKEIRYTRTSEFTDEVASTYLDDLMPADELFERCSRRDARLFQNPVYS